MAEKDKDAKKIVQLGGGTGSETIAKALREDPMIELAFIVSMFDDGGSNRRMIEEFELMPPSGIGQLLVALSGNPGVLTDFFAYRFHQGEGISGMTGRNLFIAALADILGSELEAYAAAAKLLAIEGKVVPNTMQAATLVATYEDGSVIRHEHDIDVFLNPQNLRITNLATDPSTSLEEEARQIVEEADLILFGPGSLFTNTIAHLTVEGLVEAIEKSQAVVAMILNLMTTNAESPGFTAADYVDVLSEYLPIELLSALVVNTDLNFPAEVLESYDQEAAQPVEDNLHKADIPEHVKIVRAKLLDTRVIQPVPGDTIPRTKVRHDQSKLAAVIKQLLK